MEVGGGLTRLAMGAGHCRCGHFSPAQPWAIVLHPPDPPIALQSIARDAPCCQGGDGETHCSKVRSNHPSKLACTTFPQGGLGCFQLRASTSFAKQNLFDPEPVLLILATG